MNSNDGPQPATSFPALSSVLWKERELLELLLFKLEEEHLLIAAGRARWLVRAGREVDLVLDRIKQTELERAVVIEHAAAGDAGAATLDALVETATAPWRQVFEQHRAALLSLTDEIRVTADLHQEALARGHEVTRTALRVLDDDLHLDLVDERSR